MPFFEVTMMIGMFAGAVSSTISDSFSNVEDACTARNNAKKQLDKFNDFTKKTLADTSKLELDIKTFDNHIQNINATTGVQTIVLKEAFKKKKMATLLGLSVFTFILVLSLLLKYFKVFHLLRDFIFGK